MQKSCNKTKVDKKTAKGLDCPARFLNSGSPKTSNNTLDPLVAIALALPGVVTPAQAQQPISTSPKVDAFYSRYSENKGPSPYKVDTYETSMLFPLSSTWELGLGFGRDVMAGASNIGFLPNVLAAPPLALIPGTSPVPAFVLSSVSSGPSIHDTRDQATVLANYYLPDGKVSLEGGYSTENDFESFFGNLNTEWYANKKNTVFFAGFGYAYNISRPVSQFIDHIFIQSQNPSSNRGKYHTERFNLGIKQDIDRDFYIQENAELILENGDMFDPYRQIAFTGPNTLNWPGAVNAIPSPVPGASIFVGWERRPRTKITGAFVTSLVNYIPCFDSALHFNYRYAVNSWNIHSNTFELAYYQPFLKSWEIAPKVRYYTQDRASFYALSYHVDPSPVFTDSKLLRKNKASSDYRLANFGSIGWDVTLSKMFQSPNIKLSATFGFAKRATGFSLTKNKGPKNPVNQFHQKYVAVQLSSDFPQKLSFKKTEKCETIYREGEISIQPLTVFFTGMTFGRKHTDTKFKYPPAPIVPLPTVSPITSTRASMFRNRRGFGLNDIHRNGLGYDFQAGYFVRDRVEVFADLGIIGEKGLRMPSPVSLQSFKFKNRTTYRTDLGARYYFDVETIFTPYVGFMAGVEWQGKTRADVYDTFGFVQGPKIGRFTIFKAQNLFNGALLAGLDYRFDENFAVSLGTGVYYYKRNKAKTLSVPGTPFNAPNAYKISDYKNKIIVPVSISLKIIL